MAEDAVQDRSKMYEGMGWDWAQTDKNYSDQGNG
jgi:hypothetical protein